MKKRNRKLRKALLALCCVLSLIAISVGATIAYLTDAHSVTNTFTVGQVGISLDETDTDELGKKVSETRVTGNKYKLIPGHTYIKDPTVHMDAKSESAYVRMLVTITKYSHLKEALEVAGLESTHIKDELVLLEKMVSGWDANKWAIEKAYPGTGDAMVYEFRYTDTPDGDTGSLEPLFTAFTLPGAIKNQPDGDDATTGYIEQLAGMSINVVAEAIQADGFADADAAWAAFEDQED